MMAVERGLITTVIKSFIYLKKKLLGFDIQEFLSDCCVLLFSIR